MTAVRFHTEDQRMDPLMIEVRCNENRMRSGNSALPYSPTEIIDVAKDVAGRGASIFHFHVRDPDSGAALHDTTLYREVVRAVKAETDLIVHPTTGFTDEPDPHERVRPILELDREPDTRVDMAALAFGVTSVDRWDRERRAFVPGDLVYNNTRRSLEVMLAELERIDMPIISVCWELSHVRTAVRLREFGKHDGHRLWQFAFTDNDLLAAGSPSVLNLQAMVQEAPRDESWLVWCQGGDVLPLAAHAVVMGGHVGIGLGDYEYARFGKPTNGDLVDAVATLTRTVGRPIASPTEARRILNLDD